MGNNNLTLLDDRNLLHDIGKIGFTIFERYAK